MPKVSEEHLQARRRQIIDAAYRCFARKGFHQATMRDIYEAAELSPGAVYHYFRSKHEIIAASFNFDYERSLEQFEAASESKDALEALRQLLSFLYAGLSSASALGAPRVNVQGWGEALINPDLLPTLQRVLDRYRQVAMKIISRAQAEGQIQPELNPLSIANTLISLYYGLELQLALNPELDVTGYTEAVMALLQNTQQRPGRTKVE